MDSKYAAPCDIALSVSVTDVECDAVSSCPGTVYSIQYTHSIQYIVNSKHTVYTLYSVQCTVCYSIQLQAAYRPRRCAPLWNICRASRNKISTTWSGRSIGTETAGQRHLRTLVLPSPTGQFGPILRFWEEKVSSEGSFLVRATETTKPALKPPLLKF